MIRQAFAFIATATVVAAAAASCSPGTTLNQGGKGGNSTTTTGTGGDPNIDIDGGGGANCAGATTCAKQGVECGPIGDGCGGVLECGDCTVPGESCGGGAVPGKCGKTECIPKTCGQLGVECGPTGDGCGGPLDCGDCTVPGETCGGGGPSKCGVSSSCTPKTCLGQAVNCDSIGDGCGNLIACGDCTVPGESCGGGGVPFVCGKTPCPPKTCQPGQCGPIADGCGGVALCGGCSLPQTCGGAGTPSVCGIPTGCTNLCLQQVSCTGGKTTTLTGKVYAPNGVDPLLNAVVYVPNAAVKPFVPGVACDNCTQASGSPLVSTTTAADGTFKLTNVPAGANIPLVIQLGRWRRQVNITNVPSCQTTALPANLTRLPKNKGEGDIPLMAFATGAVDALECVMRKIGVDDSEFTAPADGGRIHLYMGLTDHNSKYHTASIWASGGAKLPTSPTEDQLWGTQAQLDKYDMVLFPCQADEGDRALRNAAAHQNLLNYVNKGGRVFATHFSYIWFDQSTPFSTTAQWHVTQHYPSPPGGSPIDQTGYVNTSFPKGQALADWLWNVGASTVRGQIPLQVVRHDYDAVNAPSQSWMTLNDDVYFPGMGVHYTFNTPVGAAASQQCGRVLFDDFHVENTPFTATIGKIFPAECVAGAMTPQEKLLEFMIFDLGSCVTPDVPPSCQKTTCAAQGLECGPAGDGCGGQISCGTCPTGQTCGGGGVPSKCGAPQCTPRTCAQQNIECGPAGDGCGHQILCGACPAGQTCGGGGQPGVCGSQACVPRTCADQNIQCGPAGDGCGAALDCGSCPAGQTCGGGGQPGVCGSQSCTPKTCVELGANCGPVGDGCGGLLQCGTCVAPQTCGGGGKASVCGGSGPA